MSFLEILKRPGTPSSSAINPMLITQINYFGCVVNFLMSFGYIRDEIFFLKSGEIGSNKVYSRFIVF